MSDNKTYRVQRFTLFDLYTTRDKADKKNQIDIIVNGEITYFKPQDFLVRYNIDTVLQEYLTNDPGSKYPIGIITEFEIVYSPFSQVTAGDFLKYVVQMLRNGKITNFRAINDYIIRTERHGIMFQLFNSFVKTTPIVWRQRVITSRETFMYIAVKINPITDFKRAFKVVIPIEFRESFGENWFALGEMIIGVGDHFNDDVLEENGKRQVRLTWREKDVHTLEDTDGTSGRMTFNFKVTDLKHMGFDPSFFSLLPSVHNDMLPIEDSVSYECYLSFKREDVRLTRNQFPFESIEGFEWFDEIEDNLRGLIQHKSDIL